MSWSEPVAETVADGVHRLPLPLPDDGLRAVNVYVLEGDRSVTLIDTGWHGERAATDLDRMLAERGLAVGDIGDVLVTHLHGDHVGQAAAVRRRGGGRVALGVEERRALDVGRAGRAARFADRDAHLRTAGADELIERLHATTEEPEDLGWELPDRWLAGGERLALDGATLTTIATPGHTRGHVSFVDEARGLLFSGDHVLPHITPSIGFELRPSRTALQAFLASLHAIRDLDVSLVLPAHGGTFADLPGRVDELLEHHRIRLDRTRWAVPAAGASPFDVAQRLPWTRRATPFEQLDDFGQMLATWETLMHLELLADRGHLLRDAQEAALRFVPAPVARG